MMKKLMKSFAIVALAAVALTNCSKEPVVDPVTPDQPAGTMSFTAENPGMTSEDPETRTVLQTNHAIWQPDDKLMVYNFTEYVFWDYTHNDGYNVWATFTGPAMAAGSQYQILFSFSSILYQINVPNPQHPVMYNGQSSYDPKADIMLSQLMTVPAAGEPLPAPVFKRQIGVLRVVIGDKTTGSVLAADRPTSIKLRLSESKFTTLGVLQVTRPEFIFTPSVQHPTITALYDDDSNSFDFGDQSASVGCFLGLIVPASAHQIKAGMQMTVTVETKAGRTFEKTFTLTKDLRLEKNAITLLTVNMSDAEWTNKP